VLIRHNEELIGVRFGSKADMCSAQAHVRFTPNSDRKSGHPMVDRRGQRAGHPGRYATPYKLRRGPIRQEVFKVSAPGSRVFSLTMAARCCPIQDGFDPATNAICSFKLEGPDRFKHLQLQAGVDVVDWQVAQFWIDIFSSVLVHWRG
jgi:hypothetical protein